MFKFPFVSSQHMIWLISVFSHLLHHSISLMNYMIISSFWCQQLWALWWEKHMGYESIITWGIITGWLKEVAVAFPSDSWMRQKVVHWCCTLDSQLILFLGNHVRNFYNWLFLIEHNKLEKPWCSDGFLLFYYFLCCRSILKTSKLWRNTYGIM